MRFEKAELLQRRPIAHDLPDDRLIELKSLCRKLPVDPSKRPFQIAFCQFPNQLVENPAKRMAKPVQWIGFFEESIDQCLEINEVPVTLVAR